MVGVKGGNAMKLFDFLWFFFLEGKENAPSKPPAHKQVQELEREDNTNQHIDEEMRQPLGMEGNQVAGTVDGHGGGGWLDSATSSWGPWDAGRSPSAPAGRWERTSLLPEGTWPLEDPHPCDLPLGKRDVHRVAVPGSGKAI